MNLVEDCIGSVSSNIEQANRRVEDKESEKGIG